MWLKMKESYSDQKLWDTKIRQRQVDAAVKNPSTQGSQLIDAGDEEIQKLKTSMTDLASSIEERFSLFQVWRGQLESCIELDAEPNTVAIMKSIDSGVMSSIFLWCGNQILARIDEDGVMVVMLHRTCIRIHVFSAFSQDLQLCTLFALFHLQWQEKKKASKTEKTRLFFQLASMDAKGLCLGLLLDDCTGQEQEQVLANLQQQLVALWQAKAFRSKSKVALGEYIAGFLGHVAYERLCFVMFFLVLFVLFAASGPAQVATHHREHRHQASQFLCPIKF